MLQRGRVKRLELRTTMRLRINGPKYILVFTNLVDACENKPTEESYFTIITVQVKHFKNYSKQACLVVCFIEES